MKKFLLILTCICFLLSISACSKNEEKQGNAAGEITTESSVGTTKTVDKKCYPVFMERSKAEKDIENFVFGSSGWNLISRGDFLFAAYSNYVLRYDIKKNQIDKFIYLGDSSDYPLGVSVSSDGNILLVIILILIMKNRHSTIF